MYISEIQKRLTELVSGPNRYPAFNLAVKHGANPNELTDGYHIALWFEGAPAKVKNELLDICAETNPWGDTGLRVCTNCGKFMTEGYLLCIDYACSDECAIALYDGDEERLREDIGEGDGDFFYTEW